MNGDLTWGGDVAVVEWLIVFAGFIMLAVVGTVIISRSLKAFKKLNSRSDELVSISESWHIESIKEVFESLETTSDGLSKEDVTNRLAKYGPNRLP